MATAPNTSAADSTVHVPVLLRLVLAVLALTSVAYFVYGNAHAEDFRRQYPAFEPPLWNLYLTFALVSLVGISAMWYARQWGFWLLVIVAVGTMSIELFAMGFQLATLRIPIMLGLVWFVAQPAWKNFR